VRRVGTIPDPLCSACSREEIMTKKFDFVPNDFRMSAITDTMKKIFFVISITGAGAKWFLRSFAWQLVYIAFVY